MYWFILWSQLSNFFVRTPQFCTQFPSPLLSLLQTGVPQFLDMMRKAVFGYPEFLETRAKELGLEKMDNVERMRRLYRVAASEIPADQLPSQH